MGQSLADAAVRGMSNPTMADEKQMLLAAGDIEGLLALNRAEFGGFTMKAGEDDGDDGDDGDSDDEDDDADDDDDDEGDDAEGKKIDPKDERIKELSAEAKKKRIRLREQAKRIAELEAENAKFKKGKAKAKDDEDDDESDESEEAKAVKEENARLKENLRKQAIRTEFTDLVSATDAKIKFKDPKVAFRLLELDDVEIDEDGDIDGLEDAIKDLAKSAPYLLVESKNDKDDEPPARRSGQPTSSNRKSRKAADREALKKKYSINR